MRDLVKNKKAIVFIIGCLTLLILLAIFQDFIEAYFNNYAFYFSESFMFSSFWWLFIPFLYGQFYYLRRYQRDSIFQKLALVIFPILIHLFAFPLLVLFISYFFNEHTFRFQQTLEYCLSEHMLSLVIIYISSLFIFLTLLNRIKIRNSNHQFNDASGNQTIIVSEGLNKIVLNILDISYIASNSPYVDIQHKTKKYLQTDTLKSISQKINSPYFIRIHKSKIVNIKHVESYTSRLNGDYDLTLKDGTLLRVSRNYASSFKEIFHNSHRDRII